MPCKSFSEVIEDKSGTGDGDAGPGSDVKKLGSRQSPAMNVEGKDLEVDRKRSCPKSQNSVSPNLHFLAYCAGLTITKRTLLDISRDNLGDWPAIRDCLAGIIANYNETSLSS